MVAKTILVVDPDAASLSFISNALRQQQYTVLQVPSGKEGLVIAWREHPDLIIIEPLLADMPGPQLALKLRQDPRTAQVPLIALSTGNQTATRNACLEAGFGQYIVKSAEAVQVLIESVNHLLGNAPRQVEPPPIAHNGLLLSFISAKGGIGTSSICANLAMNIARNIPDAHLGVMDLVLPIGSIATIVGYEGKKNLVTLADMSLQEISAGGLQEHMQDTGVWKFNLLAGSPDPETASHLQVGNIDPIVEQMQAAYDYVLLDMGRSLARFSLPIIQRSDLIVLIVSTDLSSVTIAKTVLDYLRLKGTQDESIFVILNRAVGLEGLTKGEAEKELGIEIKTTFPYLVHFTLANNQHQPFVVKYPEDNSSVFAFKDVAGRIADTAHQLRSARSSQNVRI